MANEIVLENQKPGNPESEWGLLNGVSSSIEGFATDISSNIGGVVEFKIDTDAAAYRIDIYRLGYYGGDGARKVASIQHDGAVDQPDPIVKLDTATVDAGNWSVTDTWIVPDDAVSGVYIAKLVREDGTEGENHIPFIVRDDDGHSDVVFQTSDSTWQAYNAWGGASLYQNFLGTGAEQAVAVSYNRPVNPYSMLLGEEYAAIRWLEKNGYDVSYSSGVDTARSGSELLEHKLFLSVGHDEYWSGEQRANVEAARDAGVNLAFWGGNDVYWKTRWEPSLDSTPDDYRTLVTYKEGYPGSPSDPSPEWTGTWRDPRNTGGSDPENSLIGTIFMVNSYRSDTISVSYDYSKLRFWNNTEIAHLQPGQSIQLAPGTLGYEWNIDWDNGFRPAGLINLSSTTVTVNTLLNDPWTNDGSGHITAPATHSLTLYRHDSGALVFGAGTVFWPWALDSHNPGGVAADPNVQQAMTNLLAEMGIQPETIQDGLVAGLQSTDHLAPQAAISGLAGATTVGQPVTVLGTAWDLGGGVVAGVEFSGDDGLMWHKATGWDNWSYTWTPDKIGLVTIETRAVDDSLNLGASAPYQVVVNFAIDGFDPGYYLDMNLDVKQSGMDPWVHYSTVGWLQGRNPNEVFSTSEYLSLNPDVAQSGVNPLTHFYNGGWSEGRDPSRNFDVDLYLAANPDVKAAGINPLSHYLLFGDHEGRAISVAIGTPNSEGFDAVYYYLANPDVVQSGMDGYTHYLLYGAGEGRDPNLYFDTDTYLANNIDVATAGINPLLHYSAYGWKEGRAPSANFDTNAYLAANPDVADAGIDPLGHFLTYGIYEGRNPDPDASLST